MRIDNFYNTVIDILRKERNGFISIETFNLIAPRAQIACYNDYYNSIPKGQSTHDALAVFKTKYNFTTGTSPSGLVTMPDDYVHVIVANTAVSGVVFPILFPEEDELPYAKNPNGLRAPSFTFPIGEEIATVISDVVRFQIQLYPETAQTGTVWYYREPTTPVYNFTLSGRVIVYDPTTSVDFEIPDIFQNKLMDKCIEYFSIYLDDPSTFQFGLLKDQQE